MTAFGGGGGGGAGTEHARVTFPCGHAVCRTCDNSMQRRGFHSCPLCRTPREGFSQGQVDMAAQARTLADAAGDGDNTWPPAGWTVHRIEGGNQAVFEEFMRSRGATVTGNADWSQPNRGTGWHIVFFPTEANGDPFDVLRAVAAQPHPIGGGGGGSGGGGGPRVSIVVAVAIWRCGRANVPLLPPLLLSATTTTTTRAAATRAAGLPVLLPRKLKEAKPTGWTARRRAETW